MALSFELCVRSATACRVQRDNRSATKRPSDAGQPAGPGSAPCKGDELLDPWRISLFLHLRASAHHGRCLVVAVVPCRGGGVSRRRCCLVAEAVAPWQRSASVPWRTSFGVSSPAALWRCLRGSGACGPTLNASLPTPSSRRHDFLPCAVGMCLGPRTPSMRCVEGRSSYGT